jgi:glycosyltransferase involved in cell wall biosynthesis
MVIGVDGRSLGGAERGVARYARRTLAALAHGRTGDEVRVLLPPDAAPVPGTARVPARGGRAGAAAAALAGRPALDRVLGGADVVWAPAPRPLALPRRAGFVLTVHDLSWLERPRDFTAYERLWHGAMRPGRLARAADRVLFDSAAVRDAARARFALEPARLRLAAPGVDRVAPGALPAGLPARFVLLAGALEPRKAPDVAVRAVRLARARGLQAELVVAGEGRLAGELAGTGVHLLGRVPDPVLHALYAAALALVLPSRMEGYGLGPLEALAHGTPSVVSDLPVLRGTLGAAALHAAPGDPEAFAAALLRLEREPGLRERLVAAAPPIPTWEDTAAAVGRALEEAAR